jgi:hypothetical protein
MLSSLLASAYYDNQLSSVSISQNIQQIAVDAFFNHQSAIQAIQSLNAQAFIQINATIAVTQAAQSIAINAWYYDIGITGSFVQPQQSMSASAFSRIDAQMTLTQQSQYMTATAYNLVITAPSPIVVMTRDRILRSIRNRGSR